MCKSCGCKDAGKAIKYECACTDEEPKATPYCCGVPMKLIK